MMFAFEVLAARPEPHAAAPTIMMRVRVCESGGATVHALVLRCQIRIEPQLRRYQPEEELRLYDVFGEASRWADSLRPFLWTHVSTTVPPFTGSAEFTLPIECTYDLEVAGVKYFHGLEGGEVPLRLLFSGTAFTKGEIGFAAEPVAWDTEATYRLPASVWRDVMDLYFPNSAWLRVDRRTLDGLQRFKSWRALPTWDLALEALLKQAGEESL
jgi:Family of unknown function (DUF6084)